MVESSEIEKDTLGGEISSTCRSSHSGPEEWLLVGTSIGCISSKAHEIVAIRNTYGWLSNNLL